MKKLIGFLVLLLLIAACVGCGGKTNETGPVETAGKTENTDVVHAVRQSDGMLKIDFEKASCKNSELAVLVLKSEEAISDWQQHPEAVLAIEQITSDAEGKASLSLMPKESGGCVVAIVCADGTYTVRVE